MEHAVDALRADGEGFSMPLMTLAGRPIEAEGRAIGGRAVLRLRDVSGLKRELAELNARHEKLVSDTESLRTLIEALPSPVWARDIAGALTFVNPAYARAVEAKDPADALARGLELLDRAARDELSRERAAGKPYRGRLPAIVAGSRRNFDVLDVPTRKRQRRHRHRRDRGRGDARRARAHGRRAPPHARSAGDRRRHLRRRPAADVLQRRLSLAVGPRRRLPRPGARPIPRCSTGCAPPASCPRSRISANGRPQLHEAYRAVEAKEHMWHLPDGRTLRVVTTPNPEGGVTYLFDDVTERLDLERRYDALIRVQGETLDNLAEAVAVFGSDGRLRLHNPAFARMWRLEPPTLAERPHIETVIGWCRPLYGDDALWQALRGAVTAIDNREPVTGRLGAARRQRGRLRHGAAARRRHAGHVPGRDRHGQCRARAARAQRGAGSRRRDQGRFRPPRVLRAALAAHQHHRLRAFPRRSGDRAADRQAARISRLHHHLDQRAARDHQQHPRSRHHRRRRHEAQSRRGRHPQDHGGRRRRHPGPAGQGRHHARHPRRRRTSAASSPTSGACGRSCSTCWPTRSASRRPARPSRSRPSGAPDAVVFSVTDHGPGIPPDVQGQGVRLVRDPFARLAPSRRRPRPVAGALLRRAARRHGDARFRGRAGHHGDLRVPDASSRARDGAA